MPLTLEHNLISERLEPQTHETAQGTSFTVAVQGTFQLLYPGRLQKRVQASVRHSTTFPPAEPDGSEQVTEEYFPLQFRIFDPNGHEFTRDEVTVADLRKFRDLRGTPRGRWSYSLRGTSRTYVLLASVNETVSDPKGIIDVRLIETVASSSAPPLIGRTKVGAGVEARFDLYRVGTFVASIIPSSQFYPWHGSMRLLDPDGTAVGITASRELFCEIPLAALDKSRDPAGNPRLWTLVVSPQSGTVVGDQYVFATILGHGRINTAVLHDRIENLIGPHGRFIELIGENSEGKAKAILTITDEVAAETIDMHGLLDSRLKKEDQSTNIQAHTPMILFSATEKLDKYNLTLDVGAVKLESIDVHIGPAKKLGPQTPVVRLEIKTQGRIKVRRKGSTVAEAELRDGHLEIEIGIRIDPDGTPRSVIWVPEDPLDIDATETLYAPIAEYIEEELTDRVVGGARDLFDDPSLAARILMTIFGTHLTYLPVRFEGDDILFEHVAPLEPEPRPRRNYAGAIGRTLMLEAIGHARFHPMTLGDTWAATNLKAKIDHIVVVMMENRSYDHVLGYRTRPPINDGADGLTDVLISLIEGSGEGHDVRPLRNAGFERNVLGLRTRLPKGVGHELEDVRQQLSGTIDGPSGRRINDPKGFVDNFREKKLHRKPEGEDGVIPDDVLGYYEKIDRPLLPDVNDLPIYAHLAENYAYCDRYFSSHPGPTLPNRMYSLTGDVQYDRLGVPILDNNHGDNFLLSRALTIYDVLTKKGISWRVYESNPSITMLRMFARYATDDVNIRPRAELEADVAAGNIPALTVIEPAMHHFPQNDDHPDADMYHGQIFIKGVYDALRSNPDIWRKTLLIITYDEHGGFYDHVIPPIADVLNAPAPSVVSDEPVVSTRGGIGGGRYAGLHIRPEILEVLLGEAGPSEVPSDATIQIPYGVRVPTFVVSPWTTPGKGPSLTLDHCSIIKTVLARFCGDEKPFISDRVHASQSFESYLTEDQPRMDVPGSPTLAELPTTGGGMISETSEIVTPPLSRKRMREEQVDYHDLSGRLARMLGRSSPMLLRPAHLSARLLGAGKSAPGRFTDGA